MNYKVSIIVPMFNSEKFILRCIDSLINQTYKNIEIIVIDDGSTDNSVKELSKYKDERLKVYVKENKGVSSARNYGIKKSNGDYLLFVDSDDYIEDSMIDEMINRVSNESTFIFCNNDEIFKNRIDKRILFSGTAGELNKEVVFREIASGKAGLVCSKLVSSKVIKYNSIAFDENLKVGEDQIFFLEVAEKTEKFFYINKELYHYDRRNEESVTLKYKENLHENFICLKSKVEDFFIRNNLSSNYDKELLFYKQISFLWVAFNNEVIGIKKNGLICSLNNIKTILKKCELNEIITNKKHLDKISKLVISSVNSKFKMFSALKIIFTISLLNIKINGRG